MATWRVLNLNKVLIAESTPELRCLGLDLSLKWRSGEMERAAWCAGGAARQNAAHLTQRGAGARVQGFGCEVEDLGWRHEEVEEGGGTH